MLKNPNSVHFLARDLDFHTTYEQLKNFKEVKSLDKSSKGIIHGRLANPSVRFEITHFGRLLIYYNRIGEEKQAIKVLKPHLVCSRLRKERDIPRKFEDAAEGIQKALVKKLRGGKDSESMTGHINDLKQYIIKPLLDELEHPVTDDHGLVNLDFFEIGMLVDIEGHPLFEDLGLHDRSFKEKYAEFKYNLLSIKNEMSNIRRSIRNVLKKFMKVEVVEKDSWNSRPRLGGMSSFVVDLLLRHELGTRISDEDLLLKELIDRVNINETKEKIEYVVGGYSIALVSRKSIHDKMELIQQIVAVDQEVKKRERKFLGRLSDGLLELESSRNILVSHVRFLLYKQQFSNSCQFISSRP